MIGQLTESSLRAGPIRQSRTESDGQRNRYDLSEDDGKGALRHCKREPCLRGLRRLAQAGVHVGKLGLQRLILSCERLDLTRQASVSLLCGLSTRARKIHLLLSFDNRVVCTRLSR